MKLLMGNIHPDLDTWCILHIPHTCLQNKFRTFTIHHHVCALSLNYLSQSIITQMTATRKCSFIGSFGDLESEFTRRSTKFKLLYKLCIQQLWCISCSRIKYIENKSLYGCDQNREQGGTADHEKMHMVSPELEGLWETLFSVSMWN